MNYVWQQHSIQYHQIIFRFYLLKYSFSSTLVLASSIDVVFIFNISILSHTQFITLSLWSSYMIFHVELQIVVNSLCPCQCLYSFWVVNTLRPRQNGRHFADDIFKYIFLNENVWIPIKISLKFDPVTIQATSHYLNEWWLVYWRIYASLGLNELNMRCQLSPPDLLVYGWFLSTRNIAADNLITIIQ